MKIMKMKIWMNFDVDGPWESRLKSDLKLAKRGPKNHLINKLYFTLNKIEINTTNCQKLYHDILFKLVLKNLFTY